MSVSIRTRFTAVVAAVSIGLTGIGLASAQESLIAPPTATADQQETLPAALGGSQHGTTEQTLDIQGYGAITATLNNDTGLLTTTLPDGSTRTTSFEDAATSLQDALDNPPADATSEISAVNLKFSKKDICPYVVSAVGTVHAGSWAAVLALAAVNPAVAALATLGEGFFWTWVGSHC
ncbi:hypothetical protein BJF89_17100 [Corynebacterium sp. CNJ-954]|uniref:hypothetical protein n=1 Tax=Corynebacterium sp. CNJ-954 TaxID=1904962 RepID=UPI00096742E5|nr:hypothetical protein [Corynebacterium sp. CNJ-954]OLT54290.1 hypothetical protein BJF89_17100 [Corynebacterium sp. CNJ-954]